MTSCGVCVRSGQICITRIFLQLFLVCVIVSRFIIALFFFFSFFFQSFSKVRVGCAPSLAHLEQFRVLLNDVHEDAVDVVPQLQVHVALLLEGFANLKWKSA